jgi:hypothetical protein
MELSESVAAEVTEYTAVDLVEMVYGRGRV